MCFVRSLCMSCISYMSGIVSFVSYVVRMFFLSFIMYPVLSFAPSFLLSFRDVILSYGISLCRQVFLQCFGRPFFLVFRSVGRYFASSFGLYVFRSVVRSVWLACVCWVISFVIYI